MPSGIPRSVPTELLSSWWPNLCWYISHLGTRISLLWKYSGTVAGLRASAHSPPPPQRQGPGAPGEHCLGWQVGPGTPIPLHCCCMPEGCWLCSRQAAHRGPASLLSTKGEPRRGWKGKEGSQKSHHDSSGAAHASRASLAQDNALPCWGSAHWGVTGQGGDSLWSPMCPGVLQGSWGLADRVWQWSLISTYQDFPNSVDRGQRHRQCRVHSAAVIWLLCTTRNIT